MPSSCLNNEAGFTLTELIVALGLSALLLVFVGAGSLFVERYIHDWFDRNTVAEELALISSELVPRIQNAVSVSRFPDSACLVQSDGTMLTYAQSLGVLMRNGHRVTRTGLRVDTFRIAQHALPDGQAIDTLPVNNPPTGLYALTVVLSDSKGNSTSLRTVIRNDYEYYKYRQ